MITEKSSITNGMNIKVVLILPINMPQNSVCWHHSILTMSSDPFLPPQRQMEKSDLAMRDYKNMIVGSMQHYVFVYLLS